MNTLFSLHDVSVHKLHYPDMHIAQGCTTFISGKSGCGKSSLFCLLNGTQQATSGTITYCNQALEHYDALTLRRDVLLVRQQIFLFDQSIQENFAAFYAYRRMPCPDAACMQGILDLCQLPLPLNTPCASLSGGEKQRVYLALFLSLRAPVVLLDEPTAALDTTTAHALLGAVQTYCLGYGASLLVVSHDAALAQRYAHAHIALPIPQTGGEHEH